MAMTEKIKRYFSFEANVSKFIFSLIIIAVFSLIFGQSVYASFVGTGGSSGTFAYQYGYNGSGYGYGYSYGVGGDASYGFEGTDGKATSVSATAGQTSFTVTYTTSYSAQNRLNYGSTDSYGSNSDQTSSQTGANSLAVTGLLCNTTYHYRVETTDAGSNVWDSADATVTTSACSSSGSTSGSRGRYVSSTTTPPVVLPPIVLATVSELQSQLKSLLLRLLSLLQQKLKVLHSTAGNSSFMRNLTIGSSGEDVRTLQHYLNANGFPLALNGLGSAGNETNLFGFLTKKALAKFQVAHGITPATGYFGPVTRGYIQNH